jgi:uncharacterized membrane protein
MNIPGYSPPLFSAADKLRIRTAIEKAESKTSGEIRIHVESHPAEDVLLQAREWFARLELHNTKDRNGILLYLNLHARKVAVWGDEGIHARVQQAYWDDVIRQMIPLLKQSATVEALCLAVREIGDTLAIYFPHTGASDENELSDDISLSE